MVKKAAEAANGEISVKYWIVILTLMWTVASTAANISLYLVINPIKKDVIKVEKKCEDLDNNYNLLQTDVKLNEKSIEVNAKDINDIKLRIRKKGL